MLISLEHTSCLQKFIYCFVQHAKLLTLVGTVICNAMFKMVFEYNLGSACECRAYGSKLDKDTLRSIITDCGLSADIRGERLGLPEFAAVADALFSALHAK